MLAVVVLAVGGALVLVVRGDGEAATERRTLEAQCGGRGTTTTDPSRNPEVAGWREATTRVSYFCDDAAGAGLTRAVFATQRDLRAALLRSPPPTRLCLAGDAVLLDSLDRGFRSLCRDLRGTIVDGARRLPEPTGLSMDEIDRNGRAYDRRAATLQRRALVAHWARADGGPPRG